MIMTTITILIIVIDNYCNCNDEYNVYHLDMIITEKLI